MSGKEPKLQLVRQDGRFQREAVMEVTAQKKCGLAAHGRLRQYEECATLQPFELAPRSQGQPKAAGDLGIPKAVISFSDTKH